MLLKQFVTSYPNTLICNSIKDIILVIIVVSNLYYTDVIEIQTIHFSNSK